MSVRKVMIICGKCDRIIPNSRSNDNCFCGNNPPHDGRSCKESEFFCSECGYQARPDDAKEICPNCMTMNSFIMTKMEVF